MTLTPLVDYELTSQGIATLTLRREDKRNAMNAALAAQVLQRLEEAEREAQVVILRAADGARVRCAGHDLAELDLRNLHQENATLQVAERIRSLARPVIAMVEGGVYGGGVILLVSADIAIAAQNAEVAITSSKLGIPLSPDLYAFWSRIMGAHKIKEMVFTGATLSAADAHQAGLYNHVVASEQLASTTYNLAQRICECSSAAVANAKYQLNLLAGQTMLTREQRVGVNQRNDNLLEHPDTQRRISELIARLRRPPDGENPRP